MQNNRYLEQIAQCEDLIQRKETDLEQLSDSKKEMKRHLTSLQENLDRYSELVRETRLVAEVQREEDKKENFLGQLKKVQAEAERLRNKNADLEAQLANSQQREATQKTQMSFLTQQIQQLERLLYNMEKGPSMQTITAEPDQLELNMDDIKMDSESRKGSIQSNNYVQTRNVDFDTDDLVLTLRAKRSIHFNNIGGEKLEFPIPEPLNERTIPKVRRLEETQSIMYPQISFILDQNNVTVSAPKLYAEFVYVCSEKVKVSRILVVEDHQVFIYKNRMTRKPERSFHVAEIGCVTVSRDIDCIMQIDFRSEVSGTSLVIENYSTELFLDFLCTHQGFDASRRKIGQVPLSLNNSFKNAVCNIYRNVRKAGFLEQMDAGNSLASWSVVFVVRLENVLTIFPAPEKIIYDKFYEFRRGVQLIRMDNYNVFNNGRDTGYKKDNMFYVKVRNEGRDLIFSGASPDEKRTWITALSE